MKSHEYAAELQKTVDHILSKPEVEFDDNPFLYLRFWNKESFIAVAKAMGAGKKEFSSDDINFKPDGTCLTIIAPRNLVCRKIQEAKWVCEPLLTEKEAIDLGKDIDDIIF